MNFVCVTLSAIMLICLHQTVPLSTSFLQRYYNESSRWWLLDVVIDTAVGQLERQLLDGRTVLSRSNALVRFAMRYFVEITNNNESTSSGGAGSSSIVKVVNSFRSLSPERRRALLERFVAEQLLAQETRDQLAAEANSQRPNQRPPAPATAATDHFFPHQISNNLRREVRQHVELLLTISRALRMAREACAKTFRNELWNCPSAELEQTGAGLVTHWYGEHGPSRQLDREWLVKVQNGGGLQFRSHHPALGFGQLLRSGVKESAVWIAMVSAALVHHVALACSSSALDCHCAPFELLRIFLRRDHSVMRMSFANRTLRDDWTHMALSKTYFREPNARHECNGPEYVFDWDWERCHKSHNVFAAEGLAGELLSGALLTSRERALLNSLERVQRVRTARFRPEVPNVDAQSIQSRYLRPDEKRRLIQEALQVKRQYTFINHNILVGFQAVERTISRSNCIGFSGSCTKMIESPETQRAPKNAAIKIRVGCSLQLRNFSFAANEILRAYANSIHISQIRAQNTAHLMSLNLSRPLSLVYLSHLLPDQVPEKQLHCTSLMDGSLPVRGRRQCTPSRLLSDSSVVRHMTPDGVELLEYRPADSVMSDMPVRHRSQSGGRRLRPRDSPTLLSSHTIAVRNRHLCQVACCGSRRPLGREMVAVSVASENILYANSTIEVRRALRNYTSFFCENSD